MPRIIPILKNLVQASRSEPWALKKPIMLQYPINDICNYRCQMCNIWKDGDPKKLSPAELGKIISNPLFSELEAVGINGGEPTLRGDIADLVKVLYENLPRLKTISLITNGLNSKSVIDKIIQIGEVVKKNSGSFGVHVSVDGVKGVHDKVRGRDGGFDRAVEVIDFIKTADFINNIGIGCTVIKDNIFGVHELLEWAIQKNIHITYQLAVPHKRLYNEESISPLLLSEDERYHFIEFLEGLIREYEVDEYQNLSYLSMLGQLKYDDRRIAGCNWKHRAATLSAKGDILYCAVQSKSLGSALTEDPQELYFNNEPYLRDLIKTSCDSCAHNYSGIPRLPDLISLYKRKIRKKYQKQIDLLKGNRIIRKVLKYKNDRNFSRKLLAIPATHVGGKVLPPTMQFSKQKSERPRVMICGWYGTETLGDKAILGGVISALRAGLGTLDIYIVTLEKYITRITINQMPELDEAILLSVDDGLKLVETMDLVVFGGGPIMAISEIAEMVHIFQIAVSAKVPTILAGCGVGPLGDGSHDQGIARLLSLSSYRVYRDLRSKEIAQSLGIDTKNDWVAEDPAFTWLEDKRQNSAKGYRADYHKSGQPQLLLGLREWPYSAFDTNLSKSQADKTIANFERVIIESLKKLVIEVPNLRILPFPMCTNHFGGDDRWYYQRLFRGQVELRASLDFSYLGAEISPDAALAAFESSSAALVMRYHSLVLSLGCELPSFAIDYTLGKGKVRSLADQAGVPYLAYDQIDSDAIVQYLLQYLSPAHSIEPLNIQIKPTFKSVIQDIMDLMHNY